MSTSIISTIKALILIFVLSLGITYVSAWSGPPGPPFDCPSGYVGCDGPLHVGSATQTKTGGLNVNGALWGGGLFTNGGGYFGGNVGIGTGAPTAKLHVLGGLTRLGGGLVVNGGGVVSAGTSAGFVITRRDGAENAYDSQWYSPTTGSTRLFGYSTWSDLIHINTMNGNVGIGAAPAYRLDVQGGKINAGGGIIIEKRSSDPASPEVGQMWLLVP